MTRESSAEPSVHNDSARESVSSRVEPASFSGAEIMDLHRGYDQATGNNAIAGRGGAGPGAGGDANLPSHLTFDNSIYNSSVYGSVGTDGSYKVASLGEKEAPPKKPDSTTQVVDELMKGAGNFAFGDTISNAEAQAGKNKLQTLTEGAFNYGGAEGVKDLATELSNQGLKKYGEDAFQKSPSPQFDNSLATAKVTPNKDGTTQVQFDFAQPNSSKVNSVIFQLPKAQGKDRPIQKYFQIQDGLLNKFSASDVAFSFAA